MMTYLTLRPQLNTQFLEIVHHPQIEWLHFKLMLFNLKQIDHEFGQALHRLRTLTGEWEVGE